MIEIGKGRSAVVYDNGYKFFTGSKLASIVNFPFTGTFNDYTAIESAISSAHHGRNVLDDILDFETNGKVRVARSNGYDWDEEKQAFYLKTDFIENGTHPLLVTPQTQSSPSYHKLRDTQKQLFEIFDNIGYTGALWQIGKSNLVGFNNFLTKDDVVYIVDLESGVFPLNIIDKEYQWQQAMKGKMVFDDIQIPRLVEYVTDRDGILREYLGESRYETFSKEFDALIQHHRTWKQLPWQEKILEHLVKTEEFTEGQRDFYNEPQHESMLPMGLAIHYGAKAVKKGFTFLEENLTLENIAKAGKAIFNYTIDFGKLLISRDKKQELGEKWCRDRIQASKSKVSQEDLNQFREELQNLRGKEYIGDTAVLAFAKAAEYAVAASFFGLGLLGLIEPETSITGTVFAGGTGRTVYTTARSIQNICSLKMPPIVALATGWIPKFGNSAYINQLYVSDREKALPKFLINDVASLIGQHAPIIGGEHTRTEHLLVGLSNYMASKEFFHKQT